MGRSQRSKNNKKNMRNVDKRSEDYKTKAQLKKEHKILKRQLQMEKKVLIGFYDNYRKDCVLNSSLNKLGSKLIGIFTTEPDYTMYDLGGEDGCVVKQNGNNSIKIEVWEILESDLKKVERGYGFYSYPGFKLMAQDYSKETLLSPFGEIVIYFYNDKKDDEVVVLGGDWVEHLNYKKAVGNTNLQIVK